MPALRTYDLFIRDAWTYNDDYYRLVGLLDGAPNFSSRNFSVPEHDPLHRGTTEQLRAALGNQLARVHAVLMLSGVYATHSDWMQEELDIAGSFNKPILAILPRGSERASSVVQAAAHEVVGWNTGSIVGAIRRIAL